jgi:hypothetical protein
MCDDGVGIGSVEEQRLGEPLSTYYYTDIENKTIPKLNHAVGNHMPFRAVYTFVGTVNNPLRQLRQLGLHPSA